MFHCEKGGIENETMETFNVRTRKGYFIWDFSCVKDKINITFYLYLYYVFFKY